MIFLAAALFCAPAPLWAEVTATGDGSPSLSGTEPDPWTVSGEIWIGNTGTGTLSVENGGSVSNTYGTLGYNSGSDGTATVTGNASSWINANHLYLGKYGTGTLNVENGGSVTGTVGYLGMYSGGDGTATVTGAASSWTNANHLYVGRAGTGTLSAENGGSVSNADGYLGRYSGSSGTATGTGTASSWSNTGKLYVGMVGTGTLYVGHDGTGTLNVENGGSVSNKIGYLGYHSTGDGTVTVTGTDSSWDNSVGLYIGGSEHGSWGTGTVSVLDGGTLNVGGATKIYAGGTLTLGTSTFTSGGIAMAGGVMRPVRPLFWLGSR